MVLKADVLAAAIDHACAAHPGLPVPAMTPRGRPVTQVRVRDLAPGPGALIRCGRLQGYGEGSIVARAIGPGPRRDSALSGRVGPGPRPAAASHAQESRGWGQG